jgi:hypothetical protein
VRPEGGACGSVSECKFAHFGTRLTNSNCRWFKNRRAKWRKQKRELEQGTGKGESEGKDKLSAKSSRTNISDESDLDLSDDENRSDLKGKRVKLESASADRPQVAL